MQKLFIFLFISLLTTSCSLIEPLVYRIPIQQGNIIDQEQVDKLQLGMTKEQVAFVLGTPMVTDAFNADYWEYLYVLTGSNGSNATKTISVTFQNGKLSTISGDFDKKEDKEEDEQVKKTEQNKNSEDGDGA